MARQILTRRQLNRATLARQLLLDRADLDVVDAVGRLAGLQAQEARPPYVGLWTRLVGFDRDDLAAALRDRRLVRATGVRGTLHLTTARDYAAWRPTLAPMLADGLRLLGERGAGLDVEATAAAALRHLDTVGPLTFDQLRPRLEADFPGVNDRALGLTARMLVPLVMVPTDDPWAFPSVAAFTPARSWLDIPIAAEPDPAGLVRRYLAAFGPASVADVQAWSALPRLKPVLDGMRDELVTFSDERKRELFDLPDAPRPDPDVGAPVRLLPEFDSLVLAHDDRSRVVADEHRGQVVTRNLRVNPTFLVDGMVAGLWGATATRRAATLTLRPFATLPRAARTALTAEAERLLAFLHPEVGTRTVAIA